MWVAGCAIVYLVIQVLFYNVNIMIIDALEGARMSAANMIAN